MEAAELKDLSFRASSSAKKAVVVMDYWRQRVLLGDKSASPVVDRMIARVKELGGQVDGLLVEYQKDTSRLDQKESADLTDSKAVLAGIDVAADVRAG